MKRKGLEVNLLPPYEDRDPRRIKQTIEDFAKTVTLQAQVTNRIWLGLISAALIGSLSTPTKIFGASLRSDAVFYVVTFGVLFVLVIAFSAAYAEQSRAQELAHDYLDSLPRQVQLRGFGKPRNLYDSLRLPTFNRVAPLAQLLDGKHQFNCDPASASFRFRVAKVVYYGVLKLSSELVYFGSPGIALWYVGHLARVHSCMIGIGVVTYVASAIASITLTQVLINDFRSGCVVGTKMFTAR